MALNVLLLITMILSCSVYESESKIQMSVTLSQSKFSVKKIHMKTYCLKLKSYKSNVLILQQRRRVAKFFEVFCIESDRNYLESQLYGIQISRLKHIL